MHIQVDITSEDYMAFNTYHFRTRKLKRFLLFSVVASIALPFLFHSDGDLQLIVFVRFFVLFNLLFFVLLFLHMFLSKYVPAKKNVLTGPRSYTFSDNSFTCEAESAYSHIEWKEISSVEISARAIYLFVNMNSAYIIPARAFGGYDEFQSFGSSLQALHSKSTD